ncbi:MAG: 30S ribosome-binding factor RbfA [Candidatus Avilachnospira sp.]|jgi:ribosome-binding factor A
MKKGSIKNNRINGEVMRELSLIIRDEVKDPRIDPLMSITHVEVTPDLQFCKCFVSTLGGDESLKKTVEGLKNAEGYIRRELAHRVNLRKTPIIQFIADKSIEYGVNMSHMIDVVAMEDEMKKNRAENEDEGEI